MHDLKRMKVWFLQCNFFLQASLWFLLWLGRDTRQNECAYEYAPDLGSYILKRNLYPPFQESCKNTLLLNDKDFKLQYKITDIETKRFHRCATLRQNPRQGTSCESFVFFFERIFSFFYSQLRIYTQIWFIDLNLIFSREAIPRVEWCTLLQKCTTSSARHLFGQSDILPWHHHIRCPDRA